MKYRGKIGVALLILVGLIQMASAQVSIGHSNPDTNAVLDLQNPWEKGLMMPGAASSASFSASPSVGMSYYFSDHIYYKESLGYNALTPWKYKFAGNTTEDVYYNLAGRIGIGVSNFNLSPDAPLQVATDLPVSLTSHGSFSIGESAGSNLIMNTGEIQARQNGSGAPILLNEDGGDIAIGSVPGPVTLSTTNRVQHLYQPTGNYYDYMPPGVITMWFGSSANIPAGWAPCDGGTYALSDNSGMVTTPNLQGAFLLAAGEGTASTYAPHDSGGIDLVVLTENQNPPHDHSLNLNTATGGSHRHSLRGAYSEHDGNGNGGEDGMEDVGNDFTGYAGSHSHTLTGFTQFTGGSPHENRPTYHALLYIMKL